MTIDDLAHRTDTDGLMHLPGLASLDPLGTADSAIIRRLAGNWHQRATVKRGEPDIGFRVSGGPPAVR